jgi:hypothetical protein
MKEPVQVEKDKLHVLLRAASIGLTALRTYRGLRRQIWPDIRDSEYAMEVSEMLRVIREIKGEHFPKAEEA